MNTSFDNIFFLIFFVFTALAILVGAIWVVITEKRLKRFFLGKKAKDLEDTITELGNDISKLKHTAENIERDIVTINTKLKKSIRGLEVIRFNPFSDQGSNQSFAIGLLDESGDGVVLSSLYSRDGMSIFAKPIKNKKSEYELTLEEKEAVRGAQVE